MNGLWDRCDIFRSVPVDDGFGSVKERFVRVATNVRCRFTRLSEEEASHMQGKGSRVFWRVSTEPVSGLSHTTKYMVRRTRETF